MKKKLISLKKFTITSLLAMVMVSGTGVSSLTALTGIAIASQDEPTPVESTSQPYITANHSIGTINFDATGKANIIHDTFIVANNAPVQTPARAMQAVHATQIAREVYVESTGYNSEKDQTDDSPFITANGEHVFWGGVATNFLPFGTKIKIPDYYGDQIFTVNDRMNRRYTTRVDIWFPEKKQALNWGIRRKVRIVILES